MSFRIALRRLREAISRATITMPGLLTLTFTVQDEQHEESIVAKVAREGGKWWSNEREK